MCEADSRMGFERTEKGLVYLQRVIAGSNWSNEVNCSSQSRNLNNYSWNLNSNISAHGVDTGPNSLAELSTLSKGKIQNGEGFKLVIKQMKARNFK